MSRWLGYLKEIMKVSKLKLKYLNAHQKQLKNHLVKVTILKLSILRMFYALQSLKRLNYMEIMRKAKMDFSGCMSVRDLKIKMRSIYMMVLTVLLLVSVDRAINKKSTMDLLLYRSIYGK